MAGLRRLASSAAAAHGTTAAAAAAGHAHVWSAQAAAARAAMLELPGEYRPVPASYEPPPIAAGHHQALNFIRAVSQDGRPRFASDLVLSKRDKALKGVLYFSKYTRTRENVHRHARLGTRIQGARLTGAQRGVTRRRGTGRAEGPPGCVHGGALAALFDNLMGWLVWLDDHFVRRPSPSLPPRPPQTKAHRHRCGGTHAPAHLRLPLACGLPLACVSNVSRM